MIHWLVQFKTNQYTNNWDITYFSHEDKSISEYLGFLLNRIISCTARTSEDHIDSLLSTLWNSIKQINLIINSIQKQ